MLSETNLEAISAHLPQITHYRQNLDKNTVSWHCIRLTSLGGLQQIHSSLSQKKGICLETLGQFVKRDLVTDSC